VLIYQMLLQQSPFRGEDEDEIYDAILADEPLYPIHMPRDSVSILQKLLTREPELRLGSGPTDAQEIMSHAFFRNINWDDVYHKRITPPFIPTITSATDTSNFDQEFTSVTPVLTPVQSGKLFLYIKSRTWVLTHPLQFFPRLCKKSSVAFRILPTLLSISLFVRCKRVDGSICPLLFFFFFFSGPFLYLQFLSWGPNKTMMWFSVFFWSII
jgi:serine/threonine protein kinase